jgi:ATP-binding cassette, subfamily B, bacterial PglK
MSFSHASLDLLRRLLGLVDRRVRRLLAMLVVATTFVSALEILSILSVFPMFQLILDPDRATRSVWFHRFFGEVPHSRLIAWACAGTLTLFLLKTVASLSCSWFKFHVQSRIVELLAARLFRVYLTSPMLFHMQHRATDLLRNTTSYVAQAAQSLVGLVDLCSDTILCLGIFISLAIVQPWISLMALVLIVIMATLYVYIGQPHFLQWGRRLNIAAGKQSKTVVESVIGIKTVKVLGIERYFEHEFELQLSDLCNIWTRNSFASSIPRPVLELVTVTAIIGTIIWAAAGGESPAAIVPILILFSAAVYRMMPAMIRVTSTLQSVRVSQDAVNTLYHQLSAGGVSASRRAAVIEPPSSEITLKDATFFYQNSPRPALDRITMTIRPGEVVGLVGPSGAGKSSLADVILGLHKLSDGSRSIGGVRYEDHETVPRGLFGYVPQEPFLIDDTLRRNVALGISDDDIDERRLRAAIRVAALDSFIAGAPAGLDTIVGDRGVRLSGGQRQRIGIARAMYRDPAILVLDEATSALDATTEAEISSALNELRGRKTVIVVAHRLSTVRECDQLFYLKEGRIVDRGLFDDLVTRNEEFAATVHQMGIAPPPTVAEHTA